MIRARFAHARFEEKVLRPAGDGGCWIWTGAKNREGYGRMTIGSRRDGTRRQEQAHRFAYRFYNGPIPDGYSVLWKKNCKDACVNPKHLVVGTVSERIKAAVKAGRWVQSERAAMNLPPPMIGEDNPNARLTDQQVAEIKEKRCAGIKVCLLAKWYQTSENHIYQICSGKSRSQRGGGL